jgi:hypothetical protein
MKVKALEKEWDANPITYKQKRELHKLNALTWINGEIQIEKYYDLLEEVGEMAGIGEAELDELEMVEIDQVLQAVFMSYMDLHPNMSGD